MTSRSQISKYALALAIATSTAAGVMSPIAAPPAHAEKAVAPEKNPPGDIPDTQVFITYRSTAGYMLKVPEGWARREQGSNVSFTDKLDGVQVALGRAPASFDMAWVRKQVVPALVAGRRAVKVSAVKEVSLPAGQAFRISYADNSAPNQVTGKQVRLENDLYLLSHAGKLAEINLSAPYGSDNVDQWNLMSKSFHWAP